jgi:hypothetical protein
MTHYLHLSRIKDINVFNVYTEKKSIDASYVDTAYYGALRRMSSSQSGYIKPQHEINVATRDIGFVKADPYAFISSEIKARMSIRNDLAIEANGEIIIYFPVIGLNYEEKESFLYSTIKELGLWNERISWEYTGNLIMKGEEVNPYQ